MKRILLLLLLFLSYLANAQHVRVNQIKSTGQPEGKIVITDGISQKLKIGSIRIDSLWTKAQITPNDTARWGNGGTSVDSIKFTGSGIKTLNLYQGGLITPITATFTDEDSQTLSTDGNSGNITLSKGGGTININVNDADYSPTNELNTSLTFNEGTRLLSLVDAGGTKSVTISSSNIVNCFMNTFTASSTTVSVTWPSNFADSNYELDVKHWYLKTINGKSVRVYSAIYDFNQTPSGFSCKLDTIAGYISYFAVNSSNLYPITISNYKAISDSTNADGYTRRDRLASELSKKVPYTGATKDVDLGSYSISAKGQLIPLFNGACVIPTIADNGDGSITVGDGEYHLSTQENGKGTKNYLISGGVFTLTNNTTNYLVADYNSGTPIIHVITDVNLINETTVIPIYTAYRNGNYLHFQNWDALGVALANKVHQSIVKTQRYRRDQSVGGLFISEYGTRNLNLSAGKIWVGAVPVSLDAIATATNNLFLFYHSGGTWTSTIATQYNNSQYDNGTNLTSLTPARYAVNWIYRGVESQKHLYIILGTGDYTLSQAEIAQSPTPPTAISSHAVLVAKLIVQASSSTATSIQSAFDTQFSQSSPTFHNDLTGIQGGTTNEYYHLSSLEHTVSTQAATASLNGYLTSSNFNNFNSAYNSKINSISYGSNILTLTKQDGSTLTTTITTSGGTGEIWTELTGTYASATTFTITGTDKDVGLLELSLVTCTNSAGTTRRVGYIKTATNSSGTITCNVVTDSDIASGDINFKVAYNRKVTDYMRLITIPGECIADASYSQGMFYTDIQTASYLLPVDASVLTAAAGSGAACAFNVYKGSTNLFTSAVDLGTNTVLRGQRPNTNTISAADNVSLRITSSAGATNKAADFQAKLYIVPQSIYTAF